MAQLQGLRKALAPLLHQLAREEENWQRMRGDYNDPTWLKSQRTFYLTVAEARKIRTLCTREK